MYIRMCSEQRSEAACWFPGLGGEETEQLLAGMGFLFGAERCFGTVVPQGESTNDGLYIM